LARHQEQVARPRGRTHPVQGLQGRPHGLDGHGLEDVVAAADGDAEAAVAVQGDVGVGEHPEHQPDRAARVGAAVDPQKTAFLHERHHDQVPGATRVVALQPHRLQTPTTVLPDSAIS